MAATTITHSSRYSSTSTSTSTSTTSSSFQPSPYPTTNRAIATTKNKNPTTQTFGKMAKKFIERRSNLKPRSGDRTALAIPTENLMVEDLKKVSSGNGGGKGGSNLTALHRKLFQKGSGGSADRTAGKALTEVKPNTRTLAMVLRSERELLTQNKSMETRFGSCGFWSRKRTVNVGATRYEFDLY